MTVYETDRASMLSSWRSAAIWIACLIAGLVACPICICWPTGRREEFAREGSEYSYWCSS